MLNGTLWPVNSSILSKEYFTLLLPFELLYSLIILLWISLAMEKDLFSSELIHVSIPYDSCEILALVFKDIYKSPLLVLASLMVLLILLSGSFFITL